MIKLAETFGKYGGIWTEDCFKYIAGDLGERCSRILETVDFNSEFQVLSRFMKIPKPIIHDLGEPFKLSKAIIINNQGVFLNVIGGLLLAKKLGISLVVTGARTKEHALASALISLKLNIPLKIYLSRSLSGDPELLNAAKSLGVEVDGETCKSLYDVPEMYAFQDWFKKPGEVFFLPEKANVGPYPFPSLCEHFYSYLGQFIEEDVREALEDGYGVRIIVPIDSGTTALGIFSAFLEKKISLYTVELDDWKERKEVLVDNCCTLTKGFREKDNTIHRVLAPKLVHLWEVGRIRRIFISADKLSDFQKFFAKERGILVERASSMALATALDMEKEHTEDRIFTVIRSPVVGVL